MKKVENPKLNAKNPHFGNRYADLTEVLRVVNAALEADEKIYQTVTETNNGTQFFETHLVCAAGTVLFNKIPFIVGKQDPQGLGSAITYYRRYGLVLLFNLVAEEDDDGNAGTPAPKKKAAKKRSTDKARDAVENKLDAGATDDDEFGF